MPRLSRKQLRLKRLQLGAGALKADSERRDFYLTGLHLDQVLQGDPGDVAYWTELTDGSRRHWPEIRTPPMDPKRFRGFHETKTDEQLARKLAIRAANKRLALSDLLAREARKAAEAERTRQAKRARAKEKAGRRERNQLAAFRELLAARASCPAAP